MISECLRNALGMISGRFRVFFCAILGVFDMLFDCKNTKRKRVKQIFCDFWVDELCKKGGLPQCLLGKIYFHDRFWTPYLTWQSVRYYKSKCGLQKTYFLPFILTFILVNSELRNFSSDQVTANSLIFNKLHGHWSLVTCTFTLSLMYSIRFYAEKIGEYENKLQICNAINEIFSHLKLMSPICEDRRHFFRFLSWRVFVSSVGCTSALQIKKLHFFFALRSPCTNFHDVQVRLHLSNAKQKIAFFLCIAFGLH